MNFEEKSKPISFLRTNDFSLSLRKVSWKNLMAEVKSGVRKKELTLKVALKIQEMRRISFAL